VLTQMKAVSLALLSQSVQYTGDLNEGARHNQLTATEDYQELKRYSQHPSATYITAGA